MDHPVVAEAVRVELVPFLAEQGFQEGSSDQHSARFASADTEVSVFWDPRGEIAVLAQRRDEASPHGRWQYGEVTTATSVPGHLRRVVRLFAEQPAILAGDAPFYDDLRRRNEQRSRELTAYYSRNGPRPEWMGNNSGQ